jgi:glycosyltransferase involved in cell wall biosynthesis
MGTPELAVLISTYQRPAHLYRCLLSLTQQVNVQGLFEVVITDDGSSDDTLALAEYFSSLVDFSIKFTTHTHQDFQLSRCRNEGIAVSSAAYLLITDGDCIFPRDHLHAHLKFRRSGSVVAGDCYRLLERQSSQIDESAIQAGDFKQWVDRRERQRIRGKAVRAFIYSYLPYKMLPRLTGNNIGVWRKDLEACNGFDENFVGWGLEDRDLQRRLSMLGIRCRSILHRTAAYHLWHPPAPSFARNGVGTQNLAYYHQASVSARCQRGLAERTPSTEDRLSRPQVGVRKPLPISPPSFNNRTTLPSSGLKNVA